MRAYLRRRGGGTLGRKIDTAQVSNIQPCVTTDRDLVRWFGEPGGRGNENGFPTMTWSYAHVHIGGGETQSLIVALNREGQVVQLLDDAEELAAGDGRVTSCCISYAMMRYTTCCISVACS